MEMEPIVPRFKRSKFRKPFNDGSKFLELPESVVYHIFSFLETIDVIRASVVSTKWRYLWTSIPHLKFVYDNFRLNQSESQRYDKYKDFINRVLKARAKSVSIQSCRLSYLNNEDDHSLYRWLHILAQKHVQELYLDLSYYVNESIFALPRALFASDSLEVLELDLMYFVLKIPRYAGFSRLKSLKLVSAQLMDQKLFQNFISSCPLLENLSLKGCEFHDFKVLDISLKNLRKLVIGPDSRGDSSLDQGLCKCDLKIVCPNLVYFDLTGPLVQSLSWGENPSFLQTAIIFTFCLDDVDLNDVFADSVLKILREVCHAEVLKLHMDILESISLSVAKSGCFSTLFYNLKALRLSTGMTTCYIQSIIYLLKCAPNLQLLSVLIDNVMLAGFNPFQNFESVYKCKIFDEDIGCLTCHLKMVKLIDIIGSDDELELIRFFLKNAYVLEKMSIFWHQQVIRKTRRVVILKVLKFPRSSVYVNITFSQAKQYGKHEF